MREEVEAFIVYLEREKRASENTVISYKRDLKQLVQYLESTGIQNASKVTKTSLNSFILYLEKEGKAASSISRMLAAVKAFFHYEFMTGTIRKDPAELLKAPRVEKRVPLILTKEEVEALLRVPSETSAKEIRDKAMLELLCATGIRVSDLIALKTEDVNCSVGYVQTGSLQRLQTVAFDSSVGYCMKLYLKSSRQELLNGKESSCLFVNCNGDPMTRQGFWKIVKYYGNRAGINKTITPHSLGYSGKNSD